MSPCVDLGLIVRHAVAEVRSERATRRMVLSIGRLPTLQADAVIVKRVFTDLLSSALEVTRTRETAIIEVGSQHENDRPVIFVKDNRAGEDEGTAAGLASVRRIVEDLGGRVWSHVEPDTGATIFFTLEESDRAEADR